MKIVILDGYTANPGDLSWKPSRGDNPLLRCENAFVTPHIAWATKEARSRLIEVAINNVKAYVNKHPQNVICDGIK